MTTTESGEVNKIHRNTVFIVDDHSIVREGLKQIIALEEDLDVCGEEGNAERAIKAIALQMPCLVLVSENPGLVHARRVPLRGKGDKGRSAGLYHEKECP
jgi:DNA-binding NarL/FixJ family response regulator